MRPITGEHQATSLVLAEKDIMKKNEIPSTRAHEGLGLPSPRDFPRASNLDPHSLTHSWGGLFMTLKFNHIVVLALKVGTVKIFGTVYRQSFPCRYT